MANFWWMISVLEWCCLDGTRSLGALGRGLTRCRERSFPADDERGATVAVAVNEDARR